MMTSSSWSFCRSLSHMRAASCLVCLGLGASLARVTHGFVMTQFAGDDACKAAVSSLAPTEATVTSDTVVEAMRKGYFECAEALAAVVAANGSDAGESLVSVVSLEARALTGRISQLRQALASLAPPTQVSRQLHDVPGLEVILALSNFFGRSSPLRSSGRRAPMRSSSTSSSVTSSTPRPRWT